jgi:hypothetical protein
MPPSIGVPCICQSWQGKARQDKTRQDKARQGKARHRRRIQAAACLSLGAFHTRISDEIKRPWQGVWKGHPASIPRLRRIPIGINPSRWVFMQNSKMSQMAPPLLSLERSTSINPLIQVSLFPLPSLIHVPLVPSLIQIPVFKLFALIQVPVR